MFYMWHFEALQCSYYCEIRFYSLVESSMNPQRNKGYRLQELGVALCLYNDKEASSHISGCRISHFSKTMRRFCGVDYHWQVCKGTHVLVEES